IYYTASLSRDGHILAVGYKPGNTHTVSVRTIDLSGKSPATVAAPSYGDVSSISISPDGRWVASGSWNGIGACVLDARTGKCVFDPPLSTRAFVTFSPDGRWLVTREPGQYRLWEVGTWKPGPLLSYPGKDVGGSVAFLRGGRWMAAGISAHQVGLFDTVTW